MTERLPSVCPECGGVYERDDNTAACPVCKPSRTSRPNHYGRGSSSARGYGWTWRKLSERARRLSPQCEDCGATDDLTTDHSAEAWRRHELGQVIRLRDVAVVCRRCNSERGAARGARGSEHVRWERPDLHQLADELEREDDDDLDLEREDDDLDLEPADDDDDDLETQGGGPSPSGTSIPTARQNVRHSRRK